MGSFVPTTPSERQQMLKTIGVGSVEELFRDVPQEMRIDGYLYLPSGKSEMETLESVSALSSCMADFEIAECVSVQVSKASPLGRYHLMQAQNPVYIFTLQNGGADA